MSMGKAVISRTSHRTPIQQGESACLPAQTQTQEHRPNQKPSCKTPKPRQFFACNPWKEDPKCSPLILLTPLPQNPHTPLKTPLRLRKPKSSRKRKTMHLLLPLQPLALHICQRTLLPKQNRIGRQNIITPCNPMYPNAPGCQSG